MHSVAVALQFAGINQILPNSVQATYHGGHWIHVSKPQPNKKAVVLLAQYLPGGETLASAVTAGHPASEPELQQAGNKSHQRYQHGRPE